MKKYHQIKNDTMTKTVKTTLLALIMIMGITALSSCSDDEEYPSGGETPRPVVPSGQQTCAQPAFLKPGDKVALISPSYNIEDSVVSKAGEILRSWGLVPVVGANVGKSDNLPFSGTTEERLADVLWAYNDPEIKAIICNRGGYGTIDYVDGISSATLRNNPKWMVGYSDITTLQAASTVAGVMSIHGRMCSSFVPTEGKDSSTVLLRKMLFGSIPRYLVPANPLNRPGQGEGILIGGNLATLTPLTGTAFDVTAYDNIILFIEEIGESQHNLDRMMNILRLNGTLSRVKGIIVGQFVDCQEDLGYDNAEELFNQYTKNLNVPVCYGFPAGHGEANMPLLLGASVTLTVTTVNATVDFNVSGTKTDVKL